MPRSRIERASWTGPEASPFVRAGDGLRVRLKVTPKAASDRIGGVELQADGGAVLKVAVTAASENGKANAAVVRLLAREWWVPRSALTVTAGAADRRKTVSIAGNAERLLADLGAWRASC